RSNAEAAKDAKRKHGFFAAFAAFAFTRFSRAAPLHLERLSARSSSVASMAPRTGNYPDDRATSAISDVSRTARHLTWYSSCIVQMEWIDNAAARFLTASMICPQPSRAGPAARPRSPARWPSLSGGLGAKKNSLSQRLVAAFAFHGCVSYSDVLLWWNCHFTHALLRSPHGRYCVVRRHLHDRFPGSEQRLESGAQGSRPALRLQGRDNRHRAQRKGEHAH